LLFFGAVASAFLLYGYLGAIDRAFEVGVELAGAERLIVRHRASIVLALPESHAAKIQAVEGVRDATHATWFGGVYRDPRNYFPQFAVEPGPYQRAYPGLKLSAPEAAEWAARRDAVVVGRSLADRFGWKVGDRVSIDSTLWPRADGSTTWAFYIAGVYESAGPGVDRGQFLLRYDYFDAARHWNTAARVGWFIVRVDEREGAATVARRIDRVFANSPYETRSEGELAFVKGFVDQLGDVGAVLEVLLVAVFGTIFLVAVNSMNRSVRSRLGDFAVLKVLGFRPDAIAALILAESCGLSLTAGIVGLGLGYGLVAMGDPTEGSLPAFQFPPEAWVRGVFLALALGGSAAVPAAWTLARMPAASLLGRRR
jgi:putative ABC transport system permease protein